MIIKKILNYKQDLGTRQSYAGVREGATGLSFTLQHRLHWQTCRFVLSLSMAAMLAKRKGAYLDGWKKAKEGGK